MELELLREQIKINDRVFESTAEHIEDSEVVIPDYLPDALSIIDATAQVYLKDKNVASDRVTVQGDIVFTVLYTPENSSQIRALTAKSPFKSNFDARGISPDAVTAASVALGFAEARIVNSRKMNLRAVVDISVSAFESIDLDMISAIKSPDGKELEILTSPMEIFALKAVAEKDLTITEELYLPQGKPNIGELLRTEASILQRDAKAISNKIVAKGILNIKSLYQCENERGRLEIMEHEIPFSHIIDVDGIDENAIVDLSHTISSADIRCVEDEDGDNRILAVELTAKACAKTYETIRMRGITDAYSTEYEVELQQRGVSMSKLYMERDTQLSARDTLTSGDSAANIEKVIDVYIHPTQACAAIEGSELSITSNCDVTVLCTLEGDDRLHSIGKTLQLGYSEHLSGDIASGQVETIFQPGNVSFNLNMSGELEVRVSCDVKARVLSLCKCGVLSGAKIGEKKAVPKKTPVIVVYYVQKGEGVWDIAKRYSVRTKDLLKLNKLEIDSGLDAGSMLLIPTKKK